MTTRQLDAYNDFISGNFLAFTFLLIINAFWDIGTLVYIPLVISMAVSMMMLLYVIKAKQKKRSEK